MSIISLVLIWGELGRWWRGAESHNFEVEAGVSRELQINMDIVVKMNCDDIHVNVQDASGDHILAAKRLKADRTLWSQWVDNKGMHKLGRDSQGRVNTGSGYNELGYEDEGFGEEHVHDIVALGKKRAKWAKTPKFRGNADSCRIYGSLDLNKVQGDFHITARGHGYRGNGEHLDHSSKFANCSPYRVLTSHRVQLLAHHFGAFIRPILPVAGQPSRRHRQHSSRQLPQVSILPLCCAYCV